jgi:tetratricopeptide (TPR) repeat protein
MDAPAARLAGALGLLALFYWALLSPAAITRSHTAGLPSDVSALLDASSSHYFHERYQDALGPTLTLVERFPTQQMHLERLAHIYHALGRFADEANTWHRFMDASPTPWDACPAVAEALTRAGDAAAATAAYEKCHAIAPWDSDAAFFLGRSRERSGRLDEAAALYRRALDVDAAHADSQLGLARLDLYGNRFEQARQAALRVADRFPDHADASLIVAQAAQRSGDARQARDFFERTLRIEQRYFDAHVGMGILEFSENRKDVARHYFERALAVDPSRREEIVVWLERTGASQ